MDPLTLIGLVSGGAGLLSGLASWIGKGGSPFTSPREDFISKVLSSPEELRRFGYIPPSEFRKALNVLYSSQLSSAQSAAAQRGFSYGLGGSTIEALSTKARTPIDIARMSQEIGIMEASTKTLMDAINLALQRAQYLSGESPFETAFGIAGVAFDIGLGLYKMGLAKDYIDIIKSWTTGRDIKPTRDIYDILNLNIG